MSSLQQTLSIIREKASNDSEMGFAFEKLAKIFLENDATQTQQYSQVWHFSDWAKEREEYSKVDIGIDLVAKLTEEEGFCAIQCKFYQSDHSISKADLDSFISASSSSDFTRLVLIDTSLQPIGKNAQKVFDNLTKEYIRIQLTEIEQSRIDWSTYIDDGSVNLLKKKELKDHQIKALNDIREGLKKEDRGKMIMACGTGKTFTSLRIAEDIVGEGKMVLYMVPSLALMSQTVREWKNDSVNDFLAFSVCSDQKVGKKKSKDDLIHISLNDLAFPATTDAGKLSEKINRSDKSKMKVVFSTYQSIDVISKSQYEYGLDEFDLIICDEAHRTTGATLVGEDESNFVRIHSNEHIKGKKRLYMTATPRIYGETAKRREEEGEVNLASMDNESVFGKNLFYRSFGWAVENNLLTDYKVVVLMMDEQIVSNRVQRSFSEGAELELDDATKMVGCYKALAKIGIKTDIKESFEDKEPMKKALAFCQNIRTSEMFSSEFSAVVNDYIKNEKVNDENKTDLKVELFHVDGTFNAEQRNEKLGWLKEETDKNICRVLSNARCLSEGVDVPSLDAIMFLHPRRSQIDVVQSVGRVMRKAEGKKLGYVILPITVAPGVTAEKALNENERYEVVWQILNALRAHDERFNSTINRINLGEDVSDRIEIIDGTSTPELEATTAVIEDIKPRSNRNDSDEDDENTNLGEENVNDENNATGNETEQLSFSLTDLSQAIKAKIVEKCGTRDYWEKWAGDIASIAQKHITRINSIVLNSGTKERQAFMQFVEEIRDDLNPDITETDAIEMLAQHIITRPVFDTLFQGNRFTSENAVSKAMESVLSQIYENQIDTETRTLKRFYESVQMRAKDISTSKGRQELILELYNRFFKNAFPHMTKQLGIVYTPVEIVDFIIHSVEDVMQQEFGTSLASDNIHILDPFTGTGTFISRLLQSGILSKEEVIKKYKSEIHANEIVLLAYYIASINIEAVYDDLIKDKDYQSFDGIVLTDTFQLFEQEKDMIANLLPDNSQRRTKQKERNIKIIIGNPPYSVGQSSSNEEIKNVSYPNLNSRVEKTYVKNSTANSKKALYDSYIRAFRWASDRIEEDGVIGFVTNGSWLDASVTDGFRKSLSIEFSDIYIFHLRGNARTSGELRRKEKGNVFGEGSRTPITITILVKNKKSDHKGRILFYDIGDYLDQNQKLAKINQIKSIAGIKRLNKFKTILPNKENDWLNQGEKSFGKYPILGEKKDSNTEIIFKNYSMGLNSSRDFWSFNFDKEKLIYNIVRLIENYNSELNSGKKYQDVSKDTKKIKWSSSLESMFKRGHKLKFDSSAICEALYRPFTQSYLYFDKDLIHRMGQMQKIFPESNRDNLVIGVTGVGAQEFSCLMSKSPPSYDFLSKSQCFPLHLYEEKVETQGELTFDLPGEKSNKIAICDEILKSYKLHYKFDEISKEDIFFFIYGILHSKDYREKFANNLKKSLPRIPLLKKIDDFSLFSQSGKNLSQLHTEFNNVDMHQISIKQGDLRLLYIESPKEFFRVEKMKFASKNNKSSIIYNRNITIENIPLEAYDYVVNGKSALEWVMERQSITRDNASGIINDANEFANETMKNPRYPLELFQRVITVSLETIKIVNSLPDLDID